MRDRISQIEDDVLSILKRVSGRAIEPTLESELVADLGFDSVRLLELVAALEDHFNVFIPLNAVPRIRIVAEAVDEVAALIRQQGQP
jgi:acyl carrier protein